MQNQEEVGPTPDDYDLQEYENKNDPEIATRALQEQEQVGGEEVEPVRVIPVKKKRAPARKPRERKKPVAQEIPMQSQPYYYAPPPMQQIPPEPNYMQQQNAYDELANAVALRIQAAEEKRALRMAEEKKAQKKKKAAAKKKVAAKKAPAPKKEVVPKRAPPAKKAVAPVQQAKKAVNDISDLF